VSSRNAWVVRPKPGGNNRIDEFRKYNLVGIGWLADQDLSSVGKSGIRYRLKQRHDWNAYKIGQATGQVNRFVNKMSEGDFVIVPSGGNVYLGYIRSDYCHASSPVAGGLAHQRDVEWEFDGGAINRSTLPGKLQDSLKGRLTVFSVDADRVDQLLESEVDTRGRDPYAELEEEYLDRLQQGEIRGIGSASFEDVVATVLDNYFPNITRQATTSDDEGDTDLKAELPGDVTVRVQVKHFYPESGNLTSAAVRQLEKSMTTGDNGIVVTSTDSSDEAEEYANQCEKQIGIIDGPEFVELLFENIDEFSEQELRTLGLQETPPLIRK